jgi:hypothetical protein
MKQLLPPDEKYKGCEMIFPDTIFFVRQGQAANVAAKMLIKHDKDFCLIKIANATKLAMQNIPQEMQNVVRERRKDKNGEFSKKYQKDYQTIALEKMSESATTKVNDSPSRRKSKLEEKKN